MAYDEELALRIRHVIEGEAGLTEKKMFGGLAFLIAGKMAVAAGSDGGLMVRIDPHQSAELVSEPHVRRFEMNGRAMDGWLDVAPQALVSAEELEGWVERGVTYARSLPAK